MGDSEFESDGSCPPPKKKFKPNVLLENVLVKVDGKIYHLNRFQLALKSNYFEKSFAENFAENDSDVVEIRGLNSETFPAIMDLINGKGLKSVMNADNYLALLMGMDYLQMEIDLSIVESSIDKSSVEKVIELYNFLTVNQHYQCLESKVFTYISSHLVEIFKYDEKFVVSLPFEQFFGIIRKNDVMRCEFFGKRSVQAKQTLSQICSRWICHDVENRMQHFTAIVNAANYGYYLNSFSISNEKMEPLLDDLKKDTSQEKIEKCFQQLLNYRGEINLDDEQSRPEEESLHKNRIVNKIDETKKLTRFLNEGYLSDVTIKAGSKTYKLHRSILDTASSYFSCPTPTSDKTSEFVLDIDEKTFDLIVDFIYFDKIPKFDSNSQIVVVQLLKAAAILKSKLVLEKICVPWIKKFSSQLISKDIIELLNLAVDNNWQSESWFTNILRSFTFRLSEKDFATDTLRIGQICDAARLDELSSDFHRRILSVIKEMKHEDLLKALDVICEVHGTGKYSYLYIACLCKLILAPRSESSVQSHFLSVSCDILEDLLASEYFVIKDPQKIVDICSKWIVHDVENRYRLIPRIIFAINRNNSMDFSDFESNIPADLSNCSQEKVNDELWKLLNSNCLISRDLASKQTVWDFKSRPMFILPKNVDRDTCRVPEEVHVVDSELNEMVSLNFLRDHYVVHPKWDRLSVPKLSATVIGDTLFILCEIRCEFNVYAYNFSSKKLNVLGSAPRTMYYPMDTLLNCNNQLFWCFDDGRVMKYSIELNRWLQIYSESRALNYGPYGSDGNKLYKFNIKTVQTFDFEQSSWTDFVDLPLYPLVQRNPPIHLINFHKGFALLYAPLFHNSMVLFDSDTRSWKMISTPHCPHSNFPPGLNFNAGMLALGSEFNVELAPYGEDLLFAKNESIQQLPRSSFSSAGWQMKKQAQSDFEFEGIVAIHSTLFM